MGLIDESTASLRFGGDDLDPDEITRLLGAEAHSRHRKGDQRVRQVGDEPFIRKSGVWLRQTEMQVPGNLDVQIAELLAPLTNDLGIWQELSRRFEGDIFVGLFFRSEQAGINISPASLEMIGARGLLIGLDIYHLDIPA